MIEQMRQMQQGFAKLKKLQEELQAARITGASPDGSVKVTLQGNATPFDCEISAAAMDEGSEALSGLLTEALKDANEKARAFMAEKTTEMYKDLNISPEQMAGMPGM